MIFKIQKPLAGDMTKVLIYNEDRSITQHIPLTKRQMRELFGPMVKIYVEGDIINGELVISDIVEPQPW